jgi:hypothetical protein
VPALHKFFHDARRVKPDPAQQEKHRDRRWCTLDNGKVGKVADAWSSVDGAFLCWNEKN